MKWVKNTKGKDDAMLTLSVISLAVILFKIIFANLTFGEVTLGGVDGTTIAAVLAPTLGAYVARRHSDRSKDNKDENKQ